MRVLDKSNDRIVQAKQIKCPRCKGDGNTFMDARNDVVCSMCNGKGRVWHAGAFYRRLHQKLEDSFQY